MPSEIFDCPIHSDIRETIKNVGFKNPIYIFYRVLFQTASRFVHYLSFRYDAEILKWSFVAVKMYPLPDFERKICAPEDLRSRLSSSPRPLVFTNGCFDVLHRGHVTYLAQARALGAALVVALNTDASVRRLGKGNDRPVNALENRLAVVAALASVDWVTWFDEDTPLDLIERICPDVLVKGGDWAVDSIVGAKQTLARGGQVHSIAFLHDVSTTATLAKIRGGRDAQ